jgi:hypothetical protein
MSGEDRMPGEAEIILFGIQAALRINQQFRHAFADSTRSRAITLPLPNFPTAPDRSSMENFYRFGDGTEFAGRNLRVRSLLERLSQTGDLSPEEDQEFTRLFQEHAALSRARGPGLVTTGENAAGITNDDLVHLVTIRQWREGYDPNPSLLRRMAGSLVNIAVDYFAGMPGALSAHTPGGKALRSFLEAFEHMDVATDGRDQILEALFVAALETLRDHPELLSEDERARALVRVVGTGIYEDAKQLVSAPGRTLSDTERIRTWAAMVFGSVLKTAETTVFSQPERFLGIRGAGQAELLSGVGQAVLGAIHSADGGGAGADLATLFTRESLDGVVRAALAVVGHHPELVRAGSPFLKNLIAATAAELARPAKRLGPNLLPEAIRLILEHTAENLERLMPAGADQPAHHLLLVAGREVLKQLDAPPAAGARWRVRFGPADALRMMEAVIAEVLENPGWLERQSGDADPLLGELIRDVLDTLRRSAPARLRKQTGLAVLQAALRTAGRRLEFLDKTSKHRRLVGLVVESVLATIFRPGLHSRAAWMLMRDATVGRLVNVVLESLERHGVSEAKIAAVRRVMQEMVKALARGRPWSWDDLMARLDKALA